jgi:lactobin A/cerein 7B family class IIb bacteriocin
MSNLKRFIFMNKLNLNAYGVSELSATELEKVDGGCWLTTLFVVAVIALAAYFATDNNPDTVTIIDGDRVGI